MPIDGSPPMGCDDCPVMAKLRAYRNLCRMLRTDNEDISLPPVPEWAELLIELTEENL
jgi:hypothetical protein